MGKIFKKNILFIIPYFVLVIIISLILIVYEKAEIHIYINSNHSSFFDFFLKYWTHLGHGLIAVLLTIILLFIKVKWAVISAVSNIITAILVQFSKRLLFHDRIRPKFFFESFFSGDYDLYLIPGVNPGIHSSFPSGHTATAFAVVCLLTIIVNKNSLKILFFLAAVFVAYSRVYLSWHFMEDTLAGSVIGVVITYFTFYFFDRIKNKKFDAKIKFRKNDR